MRRMPSGPLQTQPNRGENPTLRTLRRATARTEYRHECLARLAAHRALGLNYPEGRGRCITLVALVTRSALRSLRPLSPRLPLPTWDALHALCALRTRRTLWSWVTLGARVSTASSERKRKANEQQRKNLHESLSAMQHRGSHQAHSLFPWSSSTTLAKRNLII